MTHTYKISKPFYLEFGGHLDDVNLVYETYGTLSPKKNNVVWVFHAISANADVMEWWPGLFGETCLFNPTEYFIVCVNTIGSPYGSTKPEALDFPNFSVRDIVQSQLLLAAHLGINQLHTLIGGSFGGYQALEFAFSFQGTIDHLVLLATSAKESAWGIAIHESQRLAMQSDTTFGKAGGGEAGMKAARSMAMLTYRTSDTFIAQQSDPDDQSDNFRAASYIQYQGQKFVNRFDALCYYYLTKCLDTHNIGRGRGGIDKALKKIKINTLVIGIKSDTLNPVRFQKQLAEYLPNAQYQEIDSDYGHDGFLVETQKVSELIRQFYSQTSPSKPITGRIVMKFGGSSLATDEKLLHVGNIIKKANHDNSLAVVVSARGKTTDQLIDLFDIASKGEDFHEAFVLFRSQQSLPEDDVYISELLNELYRVLSAINLLRSDDEFSRDRVLAYGELISAKTMTAHLNRIGLQAELVDARHLLYTNKVLDDFEVDIEKSRRATVDRITHYSAETILVIPGFIATSEKNKTVTLGRNGSNYSATLIGSFIEAKEIQNWTDVKGVFSANPAYVENAIRIEEMSYREANEMANFGTNLLHPKTILPLMQSSIPLRIKSTLHPDEPGTLISKKGGKSGMKAVTRIDDVALITIEGRGLLDKVGIDARIFATLGSRQISIRMISQASSERGIGFVVNRTDAEKAELALSQEFEQELRLGHIAHITVNKDVGIIAILGRHNYSLEKAIRILRKNKIWMHLISNSISGEHISLVVDNQKLNRAVQLVHEEVVK